MNQTQPSLERRESTRFQVQQGAFVALGPEYEKVGQIIDMSMGGLSFRYMAEYDVSTEAAELDIFMNDNGFYLKSVPFDTVSDCEPPENIPFSSIATRRCSVQFRELSPGQKSRLEAFIQHVAVGDA
jgi:hypothetical protein